MKIGNLFKIALKALNNNKMRCFLTMLGIIIGVASVITMLAIGQGSKDSIKKQISEMGSNMIMIFPGNMERGGVQQSSDDMQSMKPVDFENIRDEAKFVAADGKQPGTVYLRRQQLPVEGGGRQCRLS